MSTAIQFRVHGGPDVLELAELPLAAPGPGEVRLRHTAIGLNFIDVYHRTGLYPVPSLPSGLGGEAVGVVEAVGPQTSGLVVGQRVGYATIGLGAYATARVVPADRLIPLPDDLDDEIAAAILLKGMTAEYLIRRTYAVRPGDPVLVHAAAGGVGLIACQWLAALGATVIGTVGTEEKARIAHAHGCHHPIVHGPSGFVGRVRELTGGRGVPVVYDSIGKATFLESLDCLRPRGMLVAYGNASGKVEPFDITALSAKGSLFLTRPTLFAYVATRAELLTSAAALFEVVRNGTVRVTIGQRFPLAEAAAAHRALEARLTHGSTVLLP
jgi:NADPH2:quinone reductase